MSDFRKPITDADLDAYLDGHTADAERQAFEARLAEDSDANAAVQIQRDIDETLRREFQVKPPSVMEIERLLVGQQAGALAYDREPNIPRVRQNRRTLLLVSSAIVAVLAWVAVMAQWNSPNRIEPFFEQRPLAAIYAESVKQGFRPYYFCEDEERFAATFKKRQHVPLRLAATPHDRRMVGLSYVGGLSRDTTAILCYVKEKPVILFVDRKESDNPTIATDASGTSLYVHRTSLDDLVVYEVTPFEDLSMTSYLQIKK